MRLFIAVDLPEEIKSSLKKAQFFLPEKNVSKTHDFHLTLKFLGECPESFAEKICEKLETLKFRKFISRLTEVGYFGSAKSPRVVWIGMEVPEWIYDFVNDLEEKMGKLGFQKEHKFKPHVTLARIRAKVAADFLQEIKKIEFSKDKFTVSDFHLYQSFLSPNGAKHVKYRSFCASGS